MKKTKTIIVILMILGTMQQVWGADILAGKRFVLSAEASYHFPGCNSYHSNNNYIVRAEYLAFDLVTFGTGFGYETRSHSTFVEPGITLNPKISGNSVRAILGLNLFVGTDRMFIGMKRDFLVKIRPSLGFRMSLSEQAGLIFKLIFGKSSRYDFGFGAGCGLSIAL